MPDWYVGMRGRVEKKKIKTTAGETFRHQCGRHWEILFFHCKLGNFRRTSEINTSLLLGRQQHAYGVKVCHTCRSALQETGNVTQLPAAISFIPKVYNAEPSVISHYLVM